MKSPIIITVDKFFIIYDEESGQSKAVARCSTDKGDTFFTHTIGCVSGKDLLPGGALYLGKTIQEAVAKFTKKVDKSKE